MLTYLMLPRTTEDQPIDLMTDDEYVCDLVIDEHDVMESLDDTIIRAYQSVLE